MRVLQGPIVEEAVHERRQLAFYFDPACDIKTTLRRFGEVYIGMLCRPRGGSAARMVFAIAERMPEIGRRYYELVLQKTVNRLAEYFDGRVKQRELVIDDDARCPRYLGRVARVTMGESPAWMAQRLKPCAAFVPKFKWCFRILTVP